MHPLLDSLTPAQREAVCHTDGPLLILAGPGSGKTRVTTHRIAWLLEQGVPARQIVALTFTNKAADEMRSRLALLAPGSEVWVSTFHRFCARLLRMHGALAGISENFTIYDADDSRKALARTLRGLALDGLHFTPEQIASEISRAKSRMIAPDVYAARSTPISHVVAQVYPVYQARLRVSAALDFDDLLLETALLLKENPELRATLDERYRYVLVDEYQDTNLVQYAIVRALSIDHPNLAVTGDPDQAIYGWRGANLRNILSFEADFPKARVVRLERNYRSTKRILRVAQQLIGYNVARKVKGLYTENEEGPPPRLTRYYNQTQEAEAIAARILAEVQAGRRRWCDCAVFYRTNALSRAIEVAMHELGVPFQIVNGVEFYQRAEIKDMLAYLHLINNPRDEVALQRIINTPPRGIGKTTVGRLVDYATAHRIPLLDAARQAGLVETISKKAAVLVARFVAMQDRLRERASGPVEEILRHVLEETGYREQLQSTGLEEDEERLANIEELLTAARQFDERHGGETGLEMFLEQAALVNETDNWEAASDRVTLMTLHAAKGLEFPVVFIVALEHGLLPHQRSRDDPEQLEEERRLLFVGITRAKEELFLSHAYRREFRGASKISVPSEFLLELPREEIEMVELTAPPTQDLASPQTDEFCQDDPRPHGMQAGEPWEQAGADASSRVPSPAAVPRLTTAADLLAGSQSPSDVPPADAFYQGMKVEHPDYGRGKIIALAGSASLRVATVSFDEAGEKKFVLSSSKLRPAL